jgi:hypothetical protein
LSIRLRVFYEVDTSTRIAKGRNQPRDRVAIIDEAHLPGFERIEHVVGERASAKERLSERYYPGGI